MNPILKKALDILQRIANPYYAASKPEPVEGHVIPKTTAGMTEITQYFIHNEKGKVDVNVSGEETIESKVESVVAKPETRKELYTRILGKKNMDLIERGATFFSTQDENVAHETLFKMASKMARKNPKLNIILPGKKTSINYQKYLNSN